jgi:alanine dehydrogenase
MPGAVARTSTFALSNQTGDYVLRLAEQGLNAVLTDSALLRGLNTYRGAVTYAAVAEALGLKYIAPVTALKG